MEHTPRERTRYRLRRWIGTSATEAANPSRLLLAVKTALAAVLAWYLAPLIPFAEDQYSYYAPLGALVTMYPTIARSTRSGLEALLGLVLGIALGLGGLAVLRWGVPAGVALAGVIAAGVLLGGIRVLGTGRDWVALAALFVMLLGGSDAEEFSVSYLVTMAFGVLVGIVVNVVVIPPLYLRQASKRLSVLRDLTTARLAELADAVEAGQIDRDRLGEMLEEIERTSSDVTEEVEEADESGRANPRGRRHADERDENAQRLGALNRVTFITRTFVDVLLRMDSDGNPSLATPVRESFAEAMRHVAHLVGTPPADPETPTRLASAKAALDEYQRHLEDMRHIPLALLAEDASAAMCLRRMIDASRPFAPEDEPREG